MIFKSLVLRPTGPFNFLSGVFASVATNALSTVIFSPDELKNSATLYLATAVTLLAAVGWFSIGEYTSLLKQRVESSAEGLDGSPNEAIEKALVALKPAVELRLYGLYVITILFSFIWPFAKYVAMN